MTVSLGLYLVGLVAGLALAAVLRQPMLGVVWVGSCFVALVLSRVAGIAAWAVLAAKAALLGIVSITVPILFGNDLIPVNPDQELYLSTAGRIAEALRREPFGVDYVAIVGRQNRLYDVALGWLAFLNGSVSVLLFRTFNLFLSVVLCGVVYGLVRSLNPAEEKVALYAFLAAASLPSVNAYAMFVLRDVMLAVLVALVAFGIFRRRYLVAILGLALMFYSRVQLFFLLVGAWGLFLGLRFAHRFGGWAPMVRGLVVFAFFLVGYFVGPFLLPPEYDWSGNWNLLGFGGFVARFVPSLLGLDFLWARPGALEVERTTLAGIRLILFDSWLIPALFVAACLMYRRMGAQWREACLWTWGFALAYAAGYWMAYGALMMRLWVPLYPLFLVVVVPVVQAILERRRPWSTGAKPARVG